MGLGNSSEEYTNTYHNVGAQALDYIRNNIPDNWTISEKKHQKKNFISTILTSPRGKRIITIKPLTYMNESGIALRDALSFFTTPLSHTLLFHDDSDINIGSYKISYNQRSAGHRGIESIITRCGSQEFWRVKIGIRPPQEKGRKKASEFVLKKISKKDTEILNEEVFPKIITELF
jgi:PTH1 family peptidyl-tRNA hydrolase